MSYLMCDLLTDRKISRLPLRGVSFGRTIGFAGSLSGTMDVVDPTTVALAKTARAYAGRCALYAFRNGAPWWGGIVWTTPVKKSGRGAITLEVNAATFESYANHRIIREDINYTQTDQGIIIPDLWRRLQADSYGDIGVIAEDQPQGILRDRPYLATEAAFYGQRMAELAAIEDGGPGPEWTIDVYADDDGTRHKLLRMGNPIGAGVDPILTIESNNIDSWSETTDAVDGGTAFQTRGAPPDGTAASQEPIMSDIFYADDLLDQGWPLLDRSDDFADVSVLATLNEHARGIRDRESGAGTTSGYTIKVDSTNWQPNQLGLPIRLRQNDLWHDETTTTVVRPVGFKVTAADRTQNETVELVFDGEAA